MVLLALLLAGVLVHRFYSRRLEAADPWWQLNYCPGCGEPVEPDFNLCPYCGTRLRPGRRAEGV